MKFSKCLLGTVLAAGLTALVAMGAPAAGTEHTVKGKVVCAHCTFTKSTDLKDIIKPGGGDCARSCAKGGSLLIIVTDDGTIYWPMSEATPATGQNELLTKFAGQQVAATGKVIERGGSHAIVIEKIQPAHAGN